MMALDFCYTQNEKLLKNISKPIINENNKVFMGNNSITNLNVISNEKDKKINCLFDVINQTSTILGKRLLKERLLNPEIDVNIIKNRYDDTEKFLKNDLFLQIKSILLNIKDIERYSRRIVIKTLHPSELYNLYLSIKNCGLILNLLNKEEFEGLQIFISYIEKTFNLEILEKTSLRDLNNFYNSGIHPDLDKIVNKISFGEDLVEYMIKSLNGIVKEDLKFIIKNNKKEGQFIVLTKKKGDKLLSFLKEWEEIEVKDNIKIKVKDLDFSSTKTSTKIKVPKLTESHTDINTLQNMINNKIKNV
jgi:DNA mismatch repair protein MutS